MFMFVIIRLVPSLLNSENIGAACLVNIIIKLLLLLLLLLKLLLKLSVSYKILVVAFAHYTYDDIYNIMQKLIMFCRTKNCVL
jgi:hypothetical protein